MLRPEVDAPSMKWEQYLEWVAAVTSSGVRSATSSKTVCPRPAAVVTAPEPPRGGVRCKGMTGQVRAFGAEQRCAVVWTLLTLGFRVALSIR